MAKSAGKSKRKPKAYRMMFRFWMNTNKDNELAIADYLEEMRSSRALTSTIRDAIRLIQDLRQQKLDVLFQLFPWLNAWLEERAEAIAASKNNGNGGNDGGGKIIDLSAKIERLESLLISQTGAGGGLLMLAKQEQLRALPAPRILPDDADIAIGMSKVQGGNSDITANFLKSMSFISGVDFAADTSPAPTKSNGKSKSSKQKPAKTVAAPITGGIKTLAVPQLAAPSFDDDDGLSLFG